MYKILPYTLKRAKLLGVKIKPSKRANKKLDVYDPDGNYIISVGALGYMDYAYYLKYYGKKIADIKRQAYNARHYYNNDLAGYYAKQLLWS